MKRIMVPVVVAMAMFSLFSLCPVLAGAEENSTQQHAAIAPPAPPDQFDLSEVKGFSLSGCYAALTKDGEEPRKFFRVMEFNEESLNPSLLWVCLADGTRIRLIFLPHDGQKRETRIVGEVEYRIYHQPEGFAIWFVMNQIDAKDFKLNELIARREKSISGF